MSLPPRPSSRSRIARAKIVALCLAAVLLSGCSGAPQATTDGAGSADAVSVNTAFGDVDIPAEPKKVVALEGAVGPLLAAGITPVATADGDVAEGFLPAEYERVKDLPVVLGPDGWDYETIAAQNPDLIIGFVRAGTTEQISPESKAEYQRLAGIAPTVFILAEGAASTKDATLKIAEIVGSGPAAEEAKAAYEAKTAEIKTAYADVLATTTFAPVDYYEGIVTVHTPISWIGGILTDVGAKLDPVSANVTDGNGVNLSTEELGQLSAAGVILTEKDLDGQAAPGAEALLTLPTYTNLPAVASGHSFGVTYFFADRYETGLVVLDQIEDILAAL